MCARYWFSLFGLAPATPRGNSPALVSRMSAIESAYLLPRRTASKSIFALVQLFMSAVTGTFHSIIEMLTMTSHALPNRTPIRHCVDVSLCDETDDQGEFIRSQS